ENYVNHPTYKQTTLYKMRFNPDRPGVHQYATDIGWALKQTRRIEHVYNKLEFSTCGERAAVHSANPVHVVDSSRNRTFRMNARSTVID
ncbi:hypothetical protein ACW7EJ_12280, partial [Acinetobacter soli]